MCTTPPAKGSSEELNAAVTVLGIEQLLFSVKVMSDPDCGSITSSGVT